MMTTKETFEAAIAKYSPLMQTIVAMEEMAELTKELSKSIRGKDNVDAVAEEIADVQIMLAQLQIIFGCSDKVKTYEAAKIQRLRDKLEGKHEEA